jgi:AraC-like DNA-binding protein
LAQANLARALRVHDLARRAAISRPTIARQFVRQNGTTPHQWLMHQRVLAAQRRLEKTAQSRHLFPACKPTRRRRARGQLWLHDLGCRHQKRRGARHVRAFDRAR